MKRFDKLVKNKELFPLIKKIAEYERTILIDTQTLFQKDKGNNVQEILDSPILSVGKKTSNNSLIANIYQLSAFEQTFLMRRVIKFMALDPTKYYQKILSGDKKNNPLKIFRNSLDTLVEKYDANPLNIAKQKSPHEFQSELENIDGIGPGLAYLINLFYAHAGLVEYNVHEMNDVCPKIDGNDMKIAQLTGILKVYKDINSDATVEPLAEGMIEVAKHLDISPVEVDLAFWVASQAYTVKGFPTELTTARNLYTKEQFDSFPSSYYTKGKLIANYKDAKTPLPRIHFSQGELRF